ncbi:MAG: ATP-binding protein [Eubacteriales bacterium]|nr:ATP-binding protein [Eubacteriales bacterium]
MRIEEVKIYGFGSLHDVQLRFSDGMNLLYGENESGKSTLFHCLIALFYGMKRGRGRSSPQQEYSRFEPGAQLPYAAMVRLQMAQGELTIYRDFRRPAADRLLVNGKEESIRLLDRWWPVRERWLYVQTFALSGLAVMSKDELLALVQAYMQAAEGGREGFLGERAVQLLREQQKQLRQRLEEAQRSRQEEALTMAAEKRLLREQKARLEEELERSGRARDDEADMDGTDDGYDEADEYEEAVRPHSAVRRGFFRFLEKISLWLGVATIGFGLWKQQLPVVVVGAVLLALTVLLFLYRVIQHDVIQEERLYRAQFSDHEGFDLQQERRRSYRLALRREWEQVQRRLQLLEEGRMEKEGSMAGAGSRVIALTENTQLEDLKTAISLLQQAMHRQDSEQSKWMEDRLNALYQRLEKRREVHIGLYGDRMIWQEKVPMESGGMGWESEAKLWERRLEMPQLSTGTLQYIYILLRLVVTQGWPGTMTYLWDDVFLTLDDGRTVGILRELAERQGQVLIFSCQRREKQLIEEAGLPFTLIELPGRSG